MILVTGANGFVGGHVVHALRADDRHVRASSATGARAASGSRPGAARSSRATSRSRRRLQAAVAGCDTVVHLVAIRQGKPEQFQRIMVDGTRSLLAAAHEAGVGRFVHMSALGSSEETKDLVPYYGAKWEMEQDVKSAGMPYVIFRPSFIFAKDGGILPTFAKLATAGARDADHRQRPTADPADLGRRRRRVLRQGGRPRGGDRPRRSSSAAPTR